MIARYPPHDKKHSKLPSLWLMTDPRLGDALLPAIRRLPFGSAVVLRHYHLSPIERRLLFRRVLHICRQRGHMLFLAGSERCAISWRADGVHGDMRRKLSALPSSAPVHNIAEIKRAQNSGAMLYFLSPVYPTQSHPGSAVLGLYGFRQIAHRIGAGKVIALGGMNRKRAQPLTGRICHGWAAIDAFKD